MPKDLNNGARSFKSEAIGSDSFAVTINFKWLLQLFVLVGSLIYTFYSYQMKIVDMEKRIVENQLELENLITLHEAESDLKLAKMEETIKWYETELVKVGGVSLNPFSWKSKKGKK